MNNNSVQRIQFVFKFGVQYTPNLCYQGYITLNCYICLERMIHAFSITSKEYALLKVAFGSGFVMRIKYTDEQTCPVMNEWLA
jgi:hypothetical protein